MAKDDSSNEVGHEEHRSEQVAALYLLCEGQCDCKGQHVYYQDRYYRVQGCIPKRMHERCVLERLDVVSKANERGVRCDSELAERKVYALDERPYEAYCKGYDRRTHEQREPTLDWLLYKGGPKTAPLTADLLFCRCHVLSQLLV